MLSERSYELYPRCSSISNILRCPDIILLQQSCYDVPLALTHWLSFSSFHIFSSSCVISILPQFFRFLQTFFHRVKLALWKIVLIAFVFLGVAGLLSAFVAPLENQFLSKIRATVLNNLPIGFDWTNYEYIKSFSKPTLILTCVYYGIFNVLIGPITEELFFRGYLTSYYKKQGVFTPILIAVLFSLYHFWLPFHNIFRILAFAPVAYVAYKKKNIYISIWFHCMCNLFSVAGFVLLVMG